MLTRNTNGALVTGALAVALFLMAPPADGANGVLRDGAGARAMGLGGASVGSPDQPLEAMYSNPAGLGFAAGPEIQLGGIGGFINGKFSNSANLDSHMRTSGGALPEMAFVYPLQSIPISLGFGIIPDSLAAPDWRFTDKPGGLDGATSYGVQRNYAEFIAVRASAGASWKISDTLSLGADVGAEYNHNELVAPYTFQTFAPLHGFKTLLDLRTDGWGVNGTVGVVWRPVETVSLGLSYRSPTFFDTDGDASGDAGAQLQNIGAGTFQHGFHYDAEVSTQLPQMVSGGISWQAHERLRVIGQVDWINWSDAFDHLHINLKNGSNQDINGFLGTDHFADEIPLNWKDAFVYRAGMEFAVTKVFTLRGGYAFGANPVPAGTVTPMSAAILQHTLTCGLEWRQGRWTIAGAYQYDLPSTINVVTSDLASGELNHSTITVRAQTFGLTFGLRL